MSFFLLDIEHHWGDRGVSAYHFIEAENRQKVKYYFHRHFKEFGHKPAWATNKHTIDIGGGEVVELDWIEEIGNPKKVQVLEDYLPNFPKR